MEGEKRDLFNHTDYFVLFCFVRATCNGASFRRIYGRLCRHYCNVPISGSFLYVRDFVIYRIYGLRIPKPPSAFIPRPSEPLSCENSCDFAHGCWADEDRVDICWYPRGQLHESIFNVSGDEGRNVFNEAISDVPSSGRIR